MAEASSSEEDTSIATKSKQRCTFPWALHELLESVEAEGKDHIISWVGDGTAFKIHNRQAFVDELMSRVAKVSCFKSFQRTLNVWDFRLVRAGPNQGYISHPHFRRGHKELCQYIRRIPFKGARAIRQAAYQALSEQQVPAGSSTIIQSQEEVVASQEPRPPLPAPLVVPLAPTLVSETSSFRGSDDSSTEVPPGTRTAARAVVVAGGGGVQSNRGSEGIAGREIDNDTINRRIQMMLRSQTSNIGDLRTSEAILLLTSLLQQQEPNWMQMAGQQDIQRQVLLSLLCQHHPEDQASLPVLRQEERELLDARNLLEGCWAGLLHHHQLVSPNYPSFPSPPLRSIQEQEERRRIQELLRSHLTFAPAPRPPLPPRSSTQLLVEWFRSRMKN